MILEIWKIIRYLWEAKSAICIPVRQAPDERECKTVGAIATSRCLGGEFDRGIYAPGRWAL